MLISIFFDLKLVKIHIFLGSQKTFVNFFLLKKASTSIKKNISKITKKILRFKIFVKIFPVQINYSLFIYRSALLKKAYIAHSTNYKKINNKIHHQHNNQQQHCVWCLWYSCFAVAVWYTVVSVRRFAPYVQPCQRAHYYKKDNHANHHVLYAAWLHDQHGT